MCICTNSYFFFIDFSETNSRNRSPSSTTVVQIEPRRRSSGGLQRQTSICLPDDDEHLDEIITYKRESTANITCLERTFHPHSPTISQTSSVDMEQQITQVSVEVHRGCGPDLFDQPKNFTSDKTNIVWEVENKETCTRTMDLEDFHYSQTHGAANVANWILGDHKRSASTYDMVRSAEVVRWRDAPKRTASIESSDLEELMENRRKVNTLARQGSNSASGPGWSDEDDEPKSKVRYNDTGSKEEVNDDNFEVFVEDLITQMDDSNPNLSDLTSSGKNVRTSEKIAAQYRELWQLRATLEEEDLSDVTCFEDDNCDSVKRADISPETSVDVGATSSDNMQISPILDCSSEVGCSDLGENDDEVAGESDVEKDKDEAKSSFQLLEPPTCHSRRQNYKAILTRRMHRTDSSGGQTTSMDSVAPASTENSFDSIDTVDTEGDSTTDASRPEGISTSFESTTDNTDSPGDNQTHTRLQQMKADSGYKSIENQNSAKTAPRLNKKKSGFTIEDISMENVPPDTIESVDEGLEITEVKDEEISMDLPEEVHLELVGATASSQNVLADIKSIDNNMKKERARKGSHFNILERKEGKSASKKRREYMKERQTSPRTESVKQLHLRLNESNPCDTDSRSDQQSGADSFDDGKKLPPVGSNLRILTRFFRPNHRTNRPRPNSRDYSVDKKSDELFREFSRRDPTYDLPMDYLLRSRSPRLQGHNTRRFHHRCRQMKHESGSPRAGRKKISPQDSIEEEISHPDSDPEAGDSQMSGDSPGIPITSEDTLLAHAGSSTDIPVIKLIEEEVGK